MWWWLFGVFIVFLLIFCVRTPIHASGAKQEIRDLSPTHLASIAKQTNNITVVIGSGPGSLTCAALLATLGYPIVLFEQHDRIGGTLHTFHNREKRKFDTGLHYVGKLDSCAQKILNFLFSDRVLQHMWLKLPQVYDKAVFAFSGCQPSSTTFLFREGYDTFQADLCARFPLNVAEITHFLSTIRTASQFKSLYVLKFLPLWLAKMGYRCLKVDSCMLQTYGDWLRKHVSNVELRMVLSAQFANYGSSPESCPLGFAASVIDHYVRGGAYYPSGGPDRLAQSFANVILEHQGQIYTRANICRINISEENQNQVQSVTVSVRGNKEYEVRCTRVICGANLVSLTQKLLTSKVSTKHFLRLNALTREAALTPDVEYIFLFVSLRESVSLPRHNIWHLPGICAEEYLENYMKNPFDPEAETSMPVFLASGSAKENVDGLGNTLVALTFGKSEWFTPESESDYAQQKEFWERRLLRVVEKHFPDLKENLLGREVGTPWTYKKFLGTMKGEAYGLAMNPTRYQSMEYLHPETPISNLYCTGQDICTFGFTGAMQAGFMTAVRVHGIQLLFRILLQFKPRQREL